MEFNVTVTKGVPGPLHLGEREYDLKSGRCFAIDPGYQVVQLWAFTPEDGRQLLGGQVE